MDKRHVRGITPADEDPIVHGYLVALPRFEPGPGFETRVLLRVWRPLPPALRRLRDALVASKLPWVVLGVLSFGALVWQASLVGLIVSFPAESRAIMFQLVDEFLPLAWSAVTTELTAVAAPALGFVGGFMSGEWMVLALVGALALLCCAGGLYWTVRHTGDGRGATHGSR